jgi:hypothetical protein
VPGFVEDGHGVDDRGGVHGQLHTEGDEDLEVAIFGGEGGDDDAASQAQRGCRVGGSSPARAIAILNPALILAKLERGEGTIGKLLVEEELYTQAFSAVKGMNDSMKNFTEIAQRINSGEGTAGKLLNDPALYNELHDTMVNLKEITRKINSGEGTIGKLVNEDKLYRDAISTLKKTEKAMEGLQDTGPISVIGSVVGTLF